MSTTNTIGVGLHYDIPAATYHADPCPEPSLSSGLARVILARSIEHAAMEHPRIGGIKRESTPAMGLGSIVHGELAGEQSDYVLGNWDNYRSKDAQAWRDGVVATGKTPVLERDVEAARPVVTAIRTKAGAGISNDPFDARGNNEVTAIWKEGEVYCRARYDRLLVDPNGYADLWDWKTTQDISPRAIERTIVKFGYHIQAAFYLRGLVACLPAYRRRVSFNFVFVETEPPYAVRRVVLSPAFLAIGDKACRDAINQWQSAIKRNAWTVTHADTLELEPPAYLEGDDEISIG